MLCTWDRLFDNLFAALGLDIRFGRFDGFLFCLFVRFRHRRRRPGSEFERRKTVTMRVNFGLDMDMTHYVSEIRPLRRRRARVSLTPSDDHLISTIPFEALVK